MSINFQFVYFLWQFTSSFLPTSPFSYETFQTLIRRLNLLPSVKTARLKTERKVRQKKNYTTDEFSLQNDGNFLSQIILIYVFLRGID